MSEHTKQSAHCQWSFTDPLTEQELDCDKEPLPGSDHCLFHKPEKTPQEVEDFTEAVRAQVEEDKNFNFAGYRFPSDWNFFQRLQLTEASFYASVFEGSAAFWYTHFQSSGKYTSAAHFRYAQFHGPASFHTATFDGPADFWQAHFLDNAVFTAAVFKGIAIFVGNTFRGEAYFPAARFANDAAFQHLLFSEEVCFTGAHFLGEASFLGAIFVGKADFGSATFAGPSVFHQAAFYDVATFRNVAQLSGCRFVTALPRADRTRPDWETRFALPATGAALCRLSKETARRAGDYRLAGDYFYFERTYADLARLPWPFFAWRRLSHLLRRWRVSCRVRRWRFSRRLSRHWVTRRLIRWWLPRVPEGADGKPLLTRQELEKAWLRPAAGPKVPWGDRLSAVAGLSLWALCGYCERPWRVFGWSVAVVVFWAMFYSWFGLVRLSGRVYPLHSFWEHLYFSVVTFTTLGFGDFEPVKSGLGMFLAASEAFIGMFMIALFVVSVAKRFSRG